MRSLLLCFFLLGCTAKSPEVLKFDLATDSVQLDWNLAVDSSSVLLLDNVMEGLTTFADSLQAKEVDLLRPMPALAKSWSISNDGKVYVFRLRENVRWTDGKPLTAQQFVDSWERLLSKDLHAANANYLFEVLEAQAFSEGRVPFSQVGIKALDPLTLEVRLRRSVPYFLHLVSSVNTFPIRKDLIQRHRSFWTNAENYVTLGPYRLTDVSSEEIKLTRFSQYWGPAPAIRDVRCFLLSEPLTALTLFQNHELNLLPRDLPSSYAKVLAADPGYRTGPKLSVYYLAFNTLKKPFRDRENRKAFIRAMDRERWAHFFQGGQSPTTTWIPPGLLGHDDAIGIASERQKSTLLKGSTISLLFSGTDSWNLLFHSLSQAVEEQLQARTKLEQTEWKSYRKLLLDWSQKKIKKLDQVPNIFTLGWVADFPDAQTFMNLFTSTSENNFTGWKNSRYDRLVELGSVANHEEDRVAYYREAQKLLLEEEAVIMPLFLTSHQALVDQNLRGVRLNVLDKWYFRNYSFADGSWWGVVRSWFKKPPKQ